MTRFSFLCASSKALLAIALLALPHAAAAEPSGCCITATSVDPYHALVTAPKGCLKAPWVLVINDEVSTPDAAQGEFFAVATDGSLRFVIDLLPGGKLTIWDAQRKELTQDSLGTRRVVEATNRLQEMTGSKDPQHAELVAQAIKLQSLDGHHALLEGTAGAASGKQLFVAYGHHASGPPEGGLLERGIAKDGSFQSVFDIVPGGKLTLWAVSLSGQVTAPVHLTALEIPAEPSPQPTP